MHPINHGIVIQGAGDICFLIKFALISKMVQMRSKITERLKEARPLFTVTNLKEDKSKSEFHVMQVLGPI